MKRRSRRTVFALDCLEGRLALDATTASVVLAQEPTSDTAVYGSADPTDGSPDPADGPVLGDPTDPGTNDGQLPSTPLDPAPLNPAGPS